MMTLLSIAAGVVVVAVLGWNLFRRFGSDRIGALMETRRATSRLVGRGELVDGNRHLDVALAVTQSTLFYENAKMQASVDLQWVREIEYDSVLATGAAPATGKVLRLRLDIRVLEFVIAADDMPRWHLALPARRAGKAA
jgi:hypothetical protein